MTTRTSGFAFASSTAVMNASTISSSEIGLRDSGRLIVQVSTCPSRSMSSGACEPCCVSCSVMMSPCLCMAVSLCVADCVCVDGGAAAQSTARPVDSLRDEVPQVRAVGQDQLLQRVLPLRGGAELAPPGQDGPR